MLIVSSPLLLDLVQSVTHTGVYRDQFEGVLVRARPTWLRVVEMFSDDSRSPSRRSSRHVGHYVAFLKTAAGDEIKVAISRDSYYSAVIGQYVVGRDGAVHFYKSKDAAEQDRP